MPHLIGLALAAIVFPASVSGSNDEQLLRKDCDKLSAELASTPKLHGRRWRVLRPGRREA